MKLACVPRLLSCRVENVLIANMRAVAASLYFALNNGEIKRCSCADGWLNVTFDWARPYPEEEVLAPERVWLHAKGEGGRVVWLHRAP